MRRRDRRRAEALARKAKPQRRPDALREPAPTGRVMVDGRQMPFWAAGALPDSGYRPRPGTITDNGDGTFEVLGEVLGEVTP